MISMSVQVIFFDSVGGEEVERVETAIGRLFATLSSKKIDSPLSIHIAPELLISHYQTTHALCDKLPLSSIFFLRIIILMFSTVFIIDDIKDW